VTAGEDQAQPIVLDGALGLVALVLLRVESRKLGDALGAVGLRASASQAVDGPPSRRGRDPCRRVGRHTVARPGRDGGDEGVLDRVLGQLQVAELADERGQDGCALAAKRALGRRDGGVRARGAHSGSRPAMGRTSTVP
jgi:hypothetical protein